MNIYPKNILSIPQQLQAFTTAGMDIEPRTEAEYALETIGYYRLRGYCFQKYDNASKQYQLGTKFSDILLLYRFDAELRHLVFGLLSEIEISLRARLINALLVYNDPLVLMDPTHFQDKQKYWQNLNAISSEIARSNDVFVRHHFDYYHGMLPIWAVTEVLSFGTISKLVKNLKTGNGTAFSVLADSYRYQSPNGNLVKPSKDMLTSWIQSCTVLRNMCAHNSRLYNRAIYTRPELPAKDRLIPQPRFPGLYEILLAAKYLCPSDELWNAFFAGFKALLTEYPDAKLACMNFPSDWEAHFSSLHT